MYVGGSYEVEFSAGGSALTTYSNALTARVMRVQKLGFHLWKAETNWAGDNVIVRGIEGAEEDLYLTGATTADQDFIAHARQDVALLLDEIERLRKLLGIDETDAS